MEPLAFGDYRVFVKPGTLPVAIISAAGIGNPREDTVGKVWMAFEWQGCFNRLGAQEHLLYLQDVSRSWFNSPRGWDELVGFLTSYMAEHGIQRKVALGLSMGASGAVMIDREIECDSVIAMSPQALPGAAFDTRFKYLWDRFEIRVPNLGEVLRSSNCHVLFSIDTPEDVRHAKALRGKSYGIHGVHNIGAEMERARVLDKFVAEIIKEAPNLKPFGFFEPDERLFDLQDVLSFGLEKPDQLPEHCFEAYQATLLEKWLAEGRSYGRFIAENPFPAHASHSIPTSAFERYAVHGWIPSENGMWAIGNRHVIRMRVMDFKSRKSRLELRLLPLLHEKHPRQRYRVTCGETVEFVAKLGEAFLTVPIEITSPVVEVVIESPDAVSLSSVGISQDTRLFAARLVGIELYPTVR